MTIKNNVTRMLDGKKIPYTAHELPEEKLGAQEVAEILGVDPACVFKTIVAVRPSGGKPILALAPGDGQVNVKSLAKAAGEKKVKVTSHNEAEKLTGLQTGGISPLALINRGFQVFIDESIRNHEKVFVSGGQRGMNVRLAPDDLIRLTGARLAGIAV